MKKTITLSTQLKVQIDEHTTGRDILLMDVYSRCANGFNFSNVQPKDRYTISADIPVELHKEINDILTNDEEFEKVKFHAMCIFKDNFGYGLRIEFPNNVKHQVIGRINDGHEDYQVKFCDFNTLLELNWPAYTRLKERSIDW